jgi:dTDP-4-dehydrorhamnose reductase
MKILLLGETGYLGSYLMENLTVDILSTRKLYDNGIQYDYVVNCIGKPNITYCELNKEETDYSNRDIISDIKKYYPSSKIINFSTYYVYNNEGICNEDSPVTYKYNYTRQKLEAEQLITNGVTFRTGKLFGHPNINKQDKLTEHIIKNNDLFLDNIHFNPTSLIQILRVINHEIKYNVFNGIYNLANDGTTTPYEYGLFINKILNSNKNITKIDMMYKFFDNYGNFVMSCEKIKKHITLIDWKVDMVNYLNNFLNKK